ncbi:MAG: YIP1 family protein [Candidatus Syntrophopropionicum ammoniitolerans]
MKEDTNHSKEHSGDQDQLLATDKTEEILQHDKDGSNNTVPLGFLEVVYGVLFEPVKTMQKVAQKPPLLTTLLVVTLLSLLSATTGFLTFTRAFGGGSGANDIFPPIHLLVPIGVVAGFVFSYVKWFGGSAILHLIADLLGGRGGLRVFLLRWVWPVCPISC